MKNWSCDQGFLILSLPYSVSAYLFDKQKRHELVIEFAIEDFTIPFTTSCLRWLFFYPCLSKVNTSIKV